jgi:hypothetical protein
MEHRADCFSKAEIPFKFPVKCYRVDKHRWVWGHISEEGMRKTKQAWYLKEGRLFREYLQHFPP